MSCNHICIIFFSVIVSNETLSVNYKTNNWIIHLCNELVYNTFNLIITPSVHFIINYFIIIIIKLDKGSRLLILPVNDKTGIGNALYSTSLPEEFSELIAM